MRISVIIPTYNEKKNIEILIPKIERLLQNRFKNDFEIVVVDDNSPDGTANSVIKLNKKYGNARVIVRKGRKGIGNALKEGYNNAKGDLIISTDADLSFDAEDMLRLVQKIEEGYDLVVGSRHIYSNYYEKPDLQTKIKGFVSKYGNIMVRVLSGVDIRDFSANFRIIKKSIWNRLKISDNTNSMLLEMILKTRYKGYKIAEIPVKFKDRLYGKSKLNLVKEAPKFLIKLIFYVFKYRVLRLN